MELLLALKMCVYQVVLVPKYVPQEQSEVAANVFSSVLGVASSAPYFPSTGAGSQWQAPAQEAMFPPQGFQSGQPQPPAGMQWNAPVPPPGTTGVPPAQGYNPAAYQGGQQVVYPVGGNVSYSGMPQQPQQPPNGPGMPMGTSMAQQSNTNESQVQNLLNVDFLKLYVAGSNKKLFHYVQIQ